MKKLIIIFLVLAVALTMIACTAETNQTDNQTETQDDLLLTRQCEYAKLIIETGLRLEEGQKLLIKSDIECYEFARLCVEAAYNAGASDVIVYWIDEDCNRLRSINADETTLGTTSSYIDELYKECLEEEIPVLNLFSNHPGSNDGVDADKIELANSAMGEYELEYSEARKYSYISWITVGVPNEDWAVQVFPDLSPEDALAKLWDCVLESVYVSGDGKSGDLWDEHLDKLVKMSEVLTAKKFKSLHYTNSLGTDLTVELSPDAIWATARSVTPEGHYFSANMPSEEIFTSPIANSANGVVYASLPLNLNGTMVEDIKFTVKDGKIVDSYASSGLDVLNDSLNSDEGSRYFGEISLVPFDSHVGKQNVLYHETLYDENASCHIAFGFSYAECLKGGQTMSNAQLSAAGLNVSKTHVDFMIGTDDMKIVGTTYDGEKIVIFENGKFTKAFC